MAIEWSAEWATVAVTAAAAAGSAGVFLRGGIEHARKAMPIFRCKWSTHELAVNVDLKVANRLDEDLIIHSVECKTRFVEKRQTPPSSPDEAVGMRYIRLASPMPLGMTVRAKSTEKLKLIIDDHFAAPWVRFIVSSSAGTLKRKRYVVRDHNRA